MRAPRDSWRWRAGRIGVALALLVAINVGGVVAWNRYLPNWPLVPTPATGEVTGDTAPRIAPALLIPKAPTDATELLEALMAVTPTPLDGWRVVEKGVENQTTVVDTACPVANRLYPAMQAQKEWSRSRSGTSQSPAPDPSISPSESSSPGRVGYSERVLETEVRSGIIQQASIYHAGSGALVFDQLQQQLASCTTDGWVLSYSTPLYFAEESLYAAFSSSGDTVGVAFFRYGDVIGTVSGRNYDLVQELASQWALRWASLLEPLCVDINSTLEDAKRQPLLPKFYEPYTEKRTLRLPDSVKTEIQATEAVTARERALTAAQEAEQSGPALSDSYIAPAAEPLLRQGDKLEVRERPESTYGLTVVIPDTPVQPAYPDMPPTPRETKAVAGPARDETGPGCGWKLLGESVPDFDEEQAERLWGERTAEAVTELTRDYQEWVRASWDYAIAYNTYLRQVATWNAWVTVATVRVAEVDWRHYDSLLEQYEEAVDDYEARLATVLECEERLAEAIRDRENAIPTPAPSDSTTPAPSPTNPELPPLPICEDRPERPTPPEPPKTDRPANMQPALN